MGHATGTEEDDDDWVDEEASVTLDSVEHIGDTDCIVDGVESNLTERRVVS